MTRIFLTALAALAALPACGKADPPLPTLTSETLRFALSPTRDEVPRDLRVTLEVPADWKRTGAGPLRTFSSGDGEGVVYGELSLELAAGRDDDPAEIPALIASHQERARERHRLRADALTPMPATTPGVTGYQLDRPGFTSRVIAKAVSPEHGFVLFCRVESSTGHSVALGERLFEACKAAKVEVLATTLAPDIEAAQRARLAQCPSENNVVFTRNERSLGPSTFGPVRAARAFATSGDKLEIDLADYAHDDWRPDAVPSEEGQVRLTFEIFPSSGQHAIAGRYPVRPRGFEAASQARFLWHDESPRVPLAVADDNGVDVIARTADKVCGRFAFKDGHHYLRGTFVVDLVIGRAAR